jgi:hypothetical protein
VTGAASASRPEHALGGCDAQHLHALRQVDQELLVARQVMDAAGIGPAKRDIASTLSQ